MEQLFAKQKTRTMLNSVTEEKFPSCSMTITETYTFPTFKGIRWNDTVTVQNITKDVKFATPKMEEKMRYTRVTTWLTTMWYITKL